MPPAPILSIVTPTRGDFSADWLRRLLEVRGDVQFVMVYPPGAVCQPISDRRVKVIKSPCRGAMMQRFVALLNADGQYVINIDDDDFIHPDVADVAAAYFENYPDSVVLRLLTEKIDCQDLQNIERPWEPIPQVDTLTVGTSEASNLRPIPIAPLDIAFDRRYLVWPFLPRRDDHATHIENFNTKIWRSDYVQKALPQLSKAMRLWGVLTWIPNYGDDRLIGLFIQAYSFKPEQILGHWLPTPGQVRFVSQHPALKPPRYHFLADFLLVKGFPQYGYLWNLFFNKLSYLPRLLAKSLLWKLQNKKYRSDSSI